MTTIKAADLFCGAGGSSTGLKRVAEALGVRLDLTAVNHWPKAVETHAANHPEARHVCESIDNIDPRKVTGGSLDLLWASPECTHHSTARGGKPINDQSRSTAWCVVRWAEALRPRYVIVENVPEFQTWGPIGSNNRPLQSRKGETFGAWLTAMRSLGYTVEAQVLNSADYGAATTRRRLFVVARFDGGRSRGAIRWPSPTHAPAGTASLFGGLPQWRGAREIIDWNERGTSIFGRTKPLADNTLRRIATGARKFWGLELNPFATDGTRVYDLSRPLPTVMTEPKFGLCQPFLLGQQSGAEGRAVGEPAPTVATKGAISLIEPFLVAFYGSGVNISSTREPLRTVTTHDRHGLVQPMALDITFRMLRPHELAAAMGFPTGYQFAGTRTDAVKQIGNAVEVNQAAALWEHPVAQVAGLRRNAA